MSVVSGDAAEAADLKNFWKIFAKNPFSAQSINFARTVAAYYLGLPLLSSRNAAQLPSLYEWPKSSEQIDSHQFAVLKRVNVAKVISAICDERVPPVLLWISNHHIEAIYYCDQFRDLKSQALLRFLEEQLTGLKLLESFCESRIDAAFSELDCLLDATDYGLLQTMQNSWNKLATSLLQMDAITDTRAGGLLHDRILEKMYSIFATMPLFVDNSIPLPRPPVYMCSISNGSSEEQYCYARLWFLIQAYAHLLSDANALLHCVEHFCWNFLKCNRECGYFDRNYSSNGRREKPRTEVTTFWLHGFQKFLLLILRLLTRDTATIEHRRDVKLSKWTTAKYYDLLNVKEGIGENDLLIRWMNSADSSDFEQLSHLFDYLRTFHSTFSHFAEFCYENITRWRNNLLREVILLEGTDDSEMPKQYPYANTLKPQVPDGVIMRAEYLARCWSYPTFTADSQLLAINLKLRPSEFIRGVSPNNAVPSARRHSLGIQFAPRTYHHSTPDVRHPIVQHPATLTSRSFPVAMRRFESRNNNVSDTGRIDSWRKLDSAVQKMNVVISEVEKELESTSRYVKALLSNQRREAQTVANSSNNNPGKLGSEGSSSNSSGEASRLSSITGQYKLFDNEQCELVNNDRYSLDSSREPEKHPEIERLNLDLLSPQPVVRNTAIVDTTVAHQQMPPPTTLFSQHCSRNSLSPLPMWLKLLPARQKDFLLSLAPTVEQTKEARKVENNVQQTRRSQQIRLLEVKEEEKRMRPSNLKFELVTTIALKQPFEM